MSMNEGKMKRVMNGVVVSSAPNKTAIVEVTMYKTHPKYKKKYRFSKRYQVHDEKNDCEVGQKVSFVACRPMSKNKHFSFIAQL